jgi:hypothetical protein
VALGTGEIPCPPLSGDLKQVLDEVPGQRGGPPSAALLVAVQVVGVRVRVVELAPQVAEQVPQVPLLGVRPALAALGEVVAEEPVEHRGVAHREVPVDPLCGHPGIQRLPGEEVVLDGVLLVGAALAVVGGPQVVGERDGLRAHLGPGDSLGG